MLAWELTSKKLGLLDGIGEEIWSSHSMISSKVKKTISSRVDTIASCLL